jgi:CRISPR/Cas system CSM-associated protein Csm5 (group 7 of RAMP superfamily)
MYCNEHTEQQDVNPTTYLGGGGGWQSKDASILHFITYMNGKAVRDVTGTKMSKMQTCY